MEIIKNGVITPSKKARNIYHKICDKCNCEFKHSKADIVEFDVCGWHNRVVICPWCGKEFYTYG